MKRIVAVILSLMMSSAGSVQIAFTAAELEACAQGGGCHIMTFEAMREMAQRAHSAGRATCESKL